jgi:hypothetical protein
MERDPYAVYTDVLVKIGRVFKRESSRWLTVDPRRTLVKTDQPPTTLFLNFDLDFVNSSALELDTVRFTHRSFNSVCTLNLFSGLSRYV